MNQKHVIVALVIALIGSWVWFLSRDGERYQRIQVVQSTPAPVAAGRAATSTEEIRQWEQVREGDPDYADAQRRLGYNVHGVERGDWKQAKVHVDRALKASPDDPKVLEDAGRVYLKLGLTAEAEKMLTRADTRVAKRALAELKAPESRD